MRFRVFSLLCFRLFSQSSGKTLKTARHFEHLTLLPVGLTSLLSNRTVDWHDLQSIINELASIIQIWQSGSVYLFIGIFIKYLRLGTVSMANGE